MGVSSSRLRVWLAVAALAAVAVCAVEAQRQSGIPSNPDDKAIVHVLNRIGFGPAPGDIERVRKMGLASYIEQQLHPDRVRDEKLSARLAGFETLAMSSRELAEKYYIPAQMERRQAQRAGAQPGQEMTPPTPTRPARNAQSMDRDERRVMLELTQQKILRAAYSEKQLQEVLVDFWFNHFNVFAGKGPTRTYLTEYEREAIRPHVFGKFRDMLGAVAESPAMLFYLDNWQSAAPQTEMEQQQQNARRRRAAMMRGEATMADLPPAMQRQRGLNENYARELMELHTIGVDGGYTQKDVQEVARAFTGWTLVQPRQGGSYRFEPRMHDDGEKTVLGMKIKSGGGRKDGEQVLDMLAKHPNTAKFIATKLARRFVADNPPKTLVDRAASRFKETDGDIREVVRTIITSREFFAAEAYRSKVKTPFEFVTSAVRATGAEASAALPLVQAVRDLGMPLYMCQPPTGYADRADAWVNTGALLNRMNFSVQLASARTRGVVLSGSVTAQSLIASALSNDLSASTRGTVAKAQAQPQALALVLGSPEFQRK